MPETRTRSQRIARFAQVAVVVLVLALAATLGQSRAAAGPACGPFGDPPAELLRGYFASFVDRHSPICIGGAVLGPWTDSSGAQRYACIYAPAEPAKDSPLPLVVFLHGSLATADTVWLTGLVRAARTTGSKSMPGGFILLAPEGRFTTHFYPSPDDRAVGWDNWYRQLNPAGDVSIGGKSYPENADAATIDHFIDAAAARYKVDERRIYVMGWSNGAAMAILYALSRPRIAAAAVYSAPDPFGAFDDPCPQLPVAPAAPTQHQLQVSNPRAHIMHVRNACDIGGICPNGDMLRFEMKVLGADFEDVILDSAGAQVHACDRSCGTDPAGGGEIGSGGELRGLYHHIRWPTAWNAPMLKYLASHPRNPSRAIETAASADTPAGAPASPSDTPAAARWRGRARRSPPAAAEIRSRRGSPRSAAWSASHR
jgi:dienelactone hydrolase